MITITLDRGHHGPRYNPGAVPGYYESARMWKLGEYLTTALQAYGIKVVPTRTSRDKDLDLEERGRKAKGSHALISLHSNAADSKKVNYVVAMYQVDDNCGSMDEVSKELAKRLDDCVAKVMDTEAKTWSTKGNRGDYYGVLRGAHAVGVPAIIIEHGFHTNPDQADWLMDDDNLKQLAEAEAQVIADFFGATKSTEFKVRIKSKTLCVRSDPGTNHKVVTKIKRGEVYTIVKTNETGTWGRLKSGVGWINIKPTYCERI